MLLLMLKYMFGYWIITFNLGDNRLTRTLTLSNKSYGNPEQEVEEEIVVSCPICIFKFRKEFTGNNF